MTRNSPVRILHVTQCVGGGVPIAIADYVRSTPEYEHHVAWPGGNDAASLGSATGHDLGDGMAAQYRAFRRALAAVRPDLVVAHSSWAGLWARIGRRAAPVIYQPHAFVFTDQRRRRVVRGVYKAVERVLARRCEAIVGLTPEEVSLAESLGARRSVLVPNLSRATSGVQRQPGLVVMSGRLAAQKDPLFFAALARAARPANPDLRFRWVGGGEDAYADALAEAGVEVTGWLPPSGAWDAMAEGSLYVHVARYEGFPLTVLDAAQLGLPVLLRDIGAFASLPGAKGSTPEELAGMIGAHFRGESATAEEISQLLRATHSVAIQSASLRELYGSSPTRWCTSDGPRLATSATGRVYRRNGVSGSTARLGRKGRNDRDTDGCGAI